MHPSLHQIYTPIHPSTNAFSQSPVCIYLYLSPPYISSYIFLTVHPSSIPPIHHFPSPGPSPSEPTPHPSIRPRSQMSSSRPSLQKTLRRYQTSFLSVEFFFNFRHQQRLPKQRWLASDESLSRCTAAIRRRLMEASLRINCSALHKSLAYT